MKILKQHNIKGVGAFIDILYLTIPMFGMAGYAMSAITMYTVTQPYIKPLVPWLTLPLFFIFGITLMLLAMLGMYLLVYKSYFAFRNHQEYKTDSPIRRDLEKIKRKLNIED